MINQHINVLRKTKHVKTYLSFPHSQAPLSSEVGELLGCSQEIFVLVDLEFGFTPDISVREHFVEVFFLVERFDSH